MTSPSRTPAEPTGDRTRLQATAVGVSAILLWATLAPLTALVGAVPPFQLVAVCFAIAAALGMGWTAARGDDPFRHFRQTPAVWAVGVGGLFGFHFLYFVALQAAPPVEANLLNYLWPLLIVVVSALLPGERLRSWHVAGALAGLAGTALLVTRGGWVAPDPAHLPGYLAALASAATWCAYSLLRRRIGADVPTDAVSGFCLITALLATLCHLASESTVWPSAPAGWAALAALGVGPVGAAFFLWDRGVRKGNIQVLGALSYAAPLLSTLLLILCGIAEGHWTVWIACALIAGGSLLASQDLLRRRDRRSPG